MMHDDWRCHDWKCSKYGCAVPLICMDGRAIDFRERLKNVWREATVHVAAKLERAGKPLSPPIISLEGEWPG